MNDAIMMRLAEAEHIRRQVDYLMPEFACEEAIQLSKVREAINGYIKFLRQKCS